MHGWISDGCVHCADCVKADPADYIEYLKESDDAADVLGLDWESLGYHLYSSDYEAGWHPGQDANPKLIGRALRAEGITDYIFVIDAKGQFDVDFSVWVHNTVEV